jgi:hypothetical protein
MSTKEIISFDLFRYALITNKIKRLDGFQDINPFIFDYWKQWNQNSTIYWVSVIIEKWYKIQSNGSNLISLQIRRLTSVWQWRPLLLDFSRFNIRAADNKNGCPMQQVICHILKRKKVWINWQSICLNFFKTLYQYT